MKRFARRAANRPNRVWSDLTPRFLLGTAGNSAIAVWGLDSPAPAASLTSLPPNDIVIMRVVGDFFVDHNAANGNNSTTFMLGVRDQVWTQGTLANDLDQRWLWIQFFVSNGPTTNSHDWLPPGVYRERVTATGVTVAKAGLPVMATRLDISPRCKIQAGQALFLAAYVTDADATYSIGASAMRMLWQQKQR